MNTWRSIGVICLGAVAVAATACEKDIQQENPVLKSPEQPGATVIEPYDDSKVQPIPMPSVNFPPATEDQRERAKPKGAPGFEEGNPGKGSALPNGTHPAS